MRSTGEISGESLKSGLEGNQRPWMILFLLLVIAGGGAFLIGISGPQAQRAWQAYLVNYAFWSGLAFGAVVFVAILNLTKARWARPLKRFAEAPAAFLPVSFVLFWALYFGREDIFPWIHEPVQGKEAWLNVGFLFARDGASLFLLTAVALILVFVSIRGDMEALSRGTDSTPDAGGGREKHSRIDRRWRIQTVLSPVLGLLYGLVLTLIAFDLIMSLDPHWFSTLFGAYYFVGSLYTGLAALIILTGLFRNAPGLKSLIGSKHFHDLGKILFGFCLLTGDFFYSQFLVIWYGNLAEETRYVILRVQTSPWEPLAWTVLVVSFGIPFVVLLSRKIKMKPVPLMILCGIVLIGMWLERLLLVAPSLWRGEQLPIGILEILITAGFLGLMALSLTAFLRRFPLVPVSDPLFRETVETSRVEISG
ncbi:MAG: hypothetical protein GTN81_03015 [Proteobacteria bacterium]|nr:hypothetical protein [Pseudomonadota bacterium]